MDGQTVADFEADLSNNLYKLWNRMSSGSYFPPPVRRVDIPKGDSKTETRPLGIPTVADRIAQEVVKRYLEPVLEPIFHRDSYGYRPGRSAIDAVRTARQRCWRYMIGRSTSSSSAAYPPLTRRIPGVSVRCRSVPTIHPTNHHGATAAQRPRHSGRHCGFSHRWFPLQWLASMRRDGILLHSPIWRLLQIAGATKRQEDARSRLCGSH